LKPGATSLINTFGLLTSENAEGRPARSKLCVHCGGPFGLVHHRRARSQFCTAACANENLDTALKAIKAKVRSYTLIASAVSR
jgi:hypothetical protein